MEQNKAGPNGLPTEYQVQCPSPIPKEWKELMTKAAPENGSKSDGSSNAWIQIKKTRYKISSRKWPDTPEISYEDWKKALTEPQQDLSVDKLIGTSTAIHCPTKEEWDTVYGLLKKTGKYAALIENCWKNYQEKSCIICNSTYGRIIYCQTQGYPVVQAKDVIAANQPSTGYKVGDWITVLDGGCRIGPGKQGDKLIGNSYQIATVVLQTSTEWKYILEGNPIQTSAISWNKATMGSQPYIRPATPEEIAKATQSTEGWKVGDKLPYKWLDEQQAGQGKKNLQKYNYGRDRKVERVEDGWALISETMNLWLPPKSQCTPLPTESKEWVPKVGEWVYVEGTGSQYTANEYKKGDVCEVVEVGCNSSYDSSVAIQIPGRPIERRAWDNIRRNQSSYLRPATPEEIRKAQSKNGKEWVCTSEDGVELYTDDAAYWAEKKHKDDLYTYTGLVHMVKGHTTTIKNGGKVFSTEQAAKEWISRQSEQVPIRDGQIGNIAKIGQKVEGYAAKYREQWGEIVKMEKGLWYDLEMKDGVIVTCYPSEIEEIRVNKSIINSQIKTKTNSYEHKEHNKQQDSIYSAIYVCTDHQVISKPERRTATPVSGGGCTGLIKGAHKVHRKAISCL